MIKTKAQIRNEIKRRVRAAIRSGKWHDDPRGAALAIALKMDEFDVSMTRVLEIGRKMDRPEKTVPLNRRLENQRDCVAIYLPDRMANIGMGWRRVRIEAVHARQVRVMDPNTEKRFTLPRDLFRDHEPLD